MGGYYLVGFFIWGFTSEYVSIRTCWCSDKGLVVKLISVSLMVAFASASILIMKRFISRYPQPQFVENEEPDEPVMEEC